MNQTMPAPVNALDTCLWDNFGTVRSLHCVISNDNKSLLQLGAPLAYR